MIDDEFFSMIEKLIELVPFGFGTPLKLITKSCHFTEKQGPQHKSNLGL